MNLDEEFVKFRRDIVYCRVFCFLFDNVLLCVVFGVYFEKDIKFEFFFNI